MHNISIAAVLAVVIALFCSGLVNLSGTSWKGFRLAIAIGLFLLLAPLLLACVPQSWAANNKLEHELVATSAVRSCLISS